MDLGNILVVDDEEAIREVVSTMLESRGYQCTSVSNGRAAQESVKKQTPDLVLSDMIMPEMDGIKLLDWLRQFDPDIPVIMVTAIHDISTALEAIRRKPLSARLVHAASLTFAVLLISFMLYVTFFDIQRLTTGRSKAAVKVPTEELAPTTEPATHP